MMYSHSGPRNFDQFLHNINNLHPTINFKFEWEENEVLPFLDIKVIRYNNKITFAIYRKPTSSEAYIHFYSLHDRQVKVATAAGLFLRGYRLCTPRLLNDEINLLFTSFINLQYPLWVINEAHQKARNSYFLPPIVKETENKKYLILPYTPALQNLKNWAKKYNLEIAFKYNNTTGRTMISNHPKSKQQAGIYSIKCNSCPLIYIGQTGRDVATRAREHFLDVRRGNEKSSFFQHVNTTNHSIDFTSAKLIHNCDNHNNRKIIESTLISQLDNFNISPGQNKFGPLLQHLVYHKIKDKIKL